MRKLKSERRFREQRKKEKEIMDNLRENGMSEKEIAEYMYVLAMSETIESTANGVVAEKLEKMKVEGKLQEAEEILKEVQEDVQG